MPKKKSSGGSWSKACKVLLVTAVLVAGVLATLYITALDRTVYAKFSGKKWSLPSHIYSRALELYEGQKLSPEDLRWELDALGYRHQQKITDAGQYALGQQYIQLYSRGFEFWDGTEPAQQITVAFDDGHVAGLTSPSGDLALARLEPMVIGGIYPNHREDRELVQLPQLPPFLAEGLVAVEDQAFYSHHGVSLRGIARAMLANIREKRFVQGGSTLTQQLVKNFYLNHERTLSRKLREALMALLLEFHASKDEILETYINEVYLGQAGERAVHGFGLASRHYFHRPLQDLSLPQVALLVGMVKGASYYNPWRNPERALARRNVVLEVMLSEKVITPQQAQRARLAPLGVVSKAQAAGRWPFPAYLDYVKRQLALDYREEDLKTEGLKIFTHFDPLVQRQLEQQLSRRATQLDTGYKMGGALQAAGVIVRVGSGEVVAMVGDRQPGYNGFNRALDANRQIGSVVKPALYLTALERPDQYTLATLLDDSAVSVKLPDGQLWQPQNFSNASHGDVLLYRALAKSYNQAAARLGMALGADSLVETLQRLGYSKTLQPLPSLSLGAVAMSPLQVAQLYHTMATSGFFSPLGAINAVYLSDNTPLKRYSHEGEQRFNHGTMHLLQYAMQAVMREGTGRSAYKKLANNLALAGKTGTTNDQRDSWFAGFSGNYVNVIWLGRDDNGKMPLTGGTGALRVWVDVMASLDNQSLPFVKPDNILYQQVDTATGLLVSEGCGSTVSLPFIVGSEPKEQGSCGSQLELQSPPAHSTPNKPPPIVDEVLDWLKGAFDW